MRNGSTRWIYADEEFRSQLVRHELSDLPALTSPSLGDYVTGHRTSWVRRWTTRTSVYYIKTYDYSTWRARVRGLGRNTWFAPSRPRREQLALKWLRDRGFGGPRVRAVVESRTLGALSRAALVTEAWPGEPLDELLPSVEVDERAVLLGELDSFVDRLHRAGFRDGNLDLRNLLARRTAEGFTLAKIDSPRFRIVRPGEPNDALARADRRRLEDSIRALGMPGTA